MVSKARLDLPDPDRPVTTTSLSRGMSTEMFFRLWTRAPCTAMVVRAATFLRSTFMRRAEKTRSAVSYGSGAPADVEKREFLDHDVALFGQARGTRHLAEQLAIREVFAGSRHA